MKKAPGGEKEGEKKKGFINNTYSSRIQKQFFLKKIYNKTKAYNTDNNANASAQQGLSKELTVVLLYETFKFLQIMLIERLLTMLF